MGGRIRFGLDVERPEEYGGLVAAAAARREEEAYTVCAVSDSTFVPAGLCYTGTWGCATLRTILFFSASSRRR